MSLDGIDLEAMTEDELLALKKEREQWRRDMGADLQAVRAGRSAALTEDQRAALQERQLVLWHGERGLREEMIAIQSAIDTKGRSRKAEEQRVAENTPGAVFARIKGVAASANSGARTTS